MRFDIISRKMASFGYVWRLFLTFGVVSADTIAKDNEYYRMPSIFHLDPYEPCVNEQDGMYCYLKFELVSEQSSELFTAIQEYSSHQLIHYNHSKLEYGVCLTKTCQEFIKDKALGYRLVLEKCLNDSFWRNYELKTRVTEVVSCEKLYKDIKVDVYDILVGFVILIILALNLVGSFQTNRNKFLDCFSVPRAWQALHAPSGEGREPWRSLLKGLAGIRSIAATIIIVIHTFMMILIHANNPRHFEKMYDNIAFRSTTNASLTVQIFFVISGILLAINYKNDAEEYNRIGFLKSVLKRWLRLTSVYAIVIALTLTWFRHTGPGPARQVLIGNEIDECRRSWFFNLAYINNYIDSTNCMLQTWYLAADFQFHVIGLAVLMFLGSRRKALLLLFTAGIAFIVGHTYVQDLEVILIANLEVARNFSAEDPTFHHVYKRGHTNLPCFVMGLALGLFLHHCQKTNLQLDKWIVPQKLRFLHRLTIPVLFLLLYIGVLFQNDSPRVSVYLRAPLAGIIKTSYGAVIAFLIFGLVFKYDSMYRGFFEWPGWKIPSRVSYCAYVVHAPIIRLMASSRTVLVDSTHARTAEMIITTLVLSYVAAIIFHVLVEAPCQRLVKLYLFKKSNEEKISFSNDNKEE